MSKSGGAYASIVERFGFLPNLLLPDGQINRRALGMHVYNNPDELAVLEDIVHPVVETLFAEFVKQYDDATTVIIYECAILFEKALDLKMDYVIATWCPEELQIDRIMKRDGLERNEALLRLERQMPAAEKVDWAAFDIDTTNPAVTKSRVETINDCLIRLLPIRKQIQEVRKQEKALRKLVSELLVNAKVIGSYQDLQKSTVVQAAPE